MELWFTENHTQSVRFSIKIKRHLVSEQSEFQKIDILESEELGRILVLDGFLMLTEKDEYIYHEMITHVPLSVNPNIKKVLVIGGGDGGAVRELCRFRSVEYVDMVEIDRRVVELCREYLPFTACSLDDPRVHLHYEDGLKFVRGAQCEYDLIIVDSTDPFGPGEGLFTKEFYGNCYKALTDDGILVNQHESTFYDEYAEMMKRAHSRIKSFFPIALVYQAHIPTYPSGHWLFGFASKKYHPVEDQNADWWLGQGLRTRYYNRFVHSGCFALPNNVRDVLRETKADNAK